LSVAIRSARNYSVYGYIDLAGIVYGAALVQGAVGGLRCFRRAGK
jgi:hypothetical protein